MSASLISIMSPYAVVLEGFEEADDGRTNDAGRGRVPLVLRLPSDVPELEDGRKVGVPQVEQHFAM